MSPVDRFRNRRQAILDWMAVAAWMMLNCISYHGTCIQTAPGIATVIPGRIAPEKSPTSSNQSPYDQSVGEQEKVIDFSVEILPILSQHCFACHDANRNDGDLRLDNEAAARQGGHTGLPLFATPLAESELYQRLIAEDPGYRMPKRSAPLSETEIQRIGMWIEQGASYDGYQPGTVGIEANIGDYRNTPGTSGSPDRAKGSLSNSQREKGTERSWFSYDQMGRMWLDWQTELNRPRYQYWPWLLGAWCGWSLLLLFRLRFVSVTVTWKRLLFSLPILILGSLVLYQQGMILELKQTAMTQPITAKRPLSPPISFDRKNLTLPTHPMHPPRLGGVYYRGNDERDPALFNQGFYRTATLEVWLVDQDDQVVGWDQEISDRPLAVKVLIRRAPGTTAQLFTQRIMDMTYLRRFRETEVIETEVIETEMKNVEDESIRIDLTVVEPDQLWEARIPLEPTSSWHQQRLAGVIYLFYGNETIDGQQGRVHFGIRYDLHVSEGKIIRPSELWMGSMYDLGGRVLIPQEGEVLLDRWFDFRPIPEIEGENPDDPELLGLPEHYQ